jgi:hypothetical protein
MTERAVSTTTTMHALSVHRQREPRRRRPRTKGFLRRRETEANATADSTRALLFSTASINGLIVPPS